MVDSINNNEKTISIDHNLSKVREYKKLGGKINYLFEKYDGMAQLFAEHYVAKRKSRRLDSRQFLEKMKEVFPQMPEEDLPHRQVLRNFKRNYFRQIKNGELGSVELAMKDEMRIISVMQDFNFFEERMIMYRKAKRVLRMAEDIMKAAYERVNSPTGIAPEFIKIFAESMDHFFKALEARGIHLDKLDDLAIRFGLMPGKVDKNNFMLLNNQFNNYQLPADHEQIKTDLGLTDDDFTDEKLEETMAKILKYDGKPTQHIIDIQPVTVIEPIPTDTEEYSGSIQESGISEEDGKGGEKEVVAD